MMKPLCLLVSIILLGSMAGCNTSGEMKSKPGQVPIKVQLVKQGDNYTLMRDNLPYTINGAGTEMNKIPSLAENGANSCRSWSTITDEYTADQFMDYAWEYGLTVTMGLDVKKERLGFDYNDSLAVKKQLDYLRSEVEKYKNHPALLVWGIGNELNLNYSNPKVWDAVNDIAKMIHEIDPNHPTTTMLAGIKKEDVTEIEKRCPDLDFLSIQMYGDLPNLQLRIKESGYTGPYIVTEWGATGHWEVARTSWGAPIEQTSLEKAESYIKRYKLAIESDPLHCLGSYVFYWGQKQERTPTWYGLFTENGHPTETIDAMHKIWKKEWPANRAPRLDSIRLDGKSAYDNIILQKSKKVPAKVFIHNYENDELTYFWELLRESTDLGVGGDYESRPEKLEGHIENLHSSGTTLIAPPDSGAYRLFVYVSDQYNKVATANIPFYVK